MRVILLSLFITLSLQQGWITGTYFILNNKVLLLVNLKYYKDCLNPVQATYVVSGNSCIYVNGGYFTITCTQQSKTFTFHGTGKYNFLKF
jgi:hypothetical protein